MRIKHSKSFNLQLAGILIAIFTSATSHAQAHQSSCGELRQKGQFGPHDYRTGKSHLPIVEDYHFTPSVEALTRGSTDILPGHDLDYTLRAFPNHHRALLALVRYGEKMQSTKPTGLNHSVECYFDRALRFSSDDPIVRMIYARFLSKKERTPEAIQQLEQATTSAQDNAFSHYNIGLIYFDLKAYDKALVQAHKAISLGFPQTALRDQLQSVGKWTEPADGSPDESSGEVTEPKNNLSPESNRQ